MPASLASASVVPKWPILAERDCWRAICRESLWWFTQVGWGAHRYAKATGDYGLTERIHRPLLRWAEDHVREWEKQRRSRTPRRKKLAIIIPRYFRKTLLFTNVLPLWCMIRDPDLAVAIGSETLDKAKSMLDPIKKVMAGDDPYAGFAWLYSSWYDPDRVWTATEVVHAARKHTAKRDPSFRAFGIEQGITGYHPDIGIVDDPLSEEKLREKGTWLRTANTAFGALRPAFRPNSLQLLVCTRYRDNDVAGEYLSREGIRSWTGTGGGQFTPYEKGEWDVYFLSAMENEESIAPEIHTTDELNAIRRSDPVMFAAQYQNRPGTGEHMLLTPQQVEDLWVDESKFPKPSAAVVTLHCDTSFRDRKRVSEGDDSTLCAVLHHTDGSGRVVCVEADGSNRWSPEDYGDKLAASVLKWQKRGYYVRCITDERSGGGKQEIWKMAVESWLINAGVRQVPSVLILSRSGMRKINRIAETMQYWLDGLVKMNRDSPGCHKLVEQALHLGYTAHDDYIDAFSDAFHPEVYRRVRNLRGEDEGVNPVQPGDWQLKGWAQRRTDDDIRVLYDEYVGKRVKELDEAWRN